MDFLLVFQIILVQLLHLLVLFLKCLLQTSSDFIFLFAEHFKRLTMASLNASKFLSLLLFQDIHLIVELVFEFV